MLREQAEQILAEVATLPLRNPDDFIDAVLDRIPADDDPDGWSIEELHLDEWSNEPDGVRYLYQNNGDYNCDTSPVFWVHQPLTHSEPIKFGYSPWPAAQAALRAAYCEKLKRKECPHCQALIHLDFVSCPNCDRYLDTGGPVVAVENVLPEESWYCLEDGGSDRYRWAYTQLLPTDHPGVLVIELDVLPSDNRRDHDAPEQWCATIRLAMPDGVGKRHRQAMFASMGVDSWTPTSNRFAVEEVRECIAGRPKKYQRRLGWKGVRLAPGGSVDLCVFSEYADARRWCNERNKWFVQACRAMSCMDYGLSAVLWQAVGYCASRLVAKAREEAGIHTIMTGFSLDRPQNEIGATGWETCYGYDPGKLVERALKAKALLPPWHVMHVENPAKVVAPFEG